MSIIFESMLMVFTQNYQNQSTLVETTACQSWRVFLRHSVDDSHVTKYNKKLSCRKQTARCSCY